MRSTRPAPTLATAATRARRGRLPLVVVVLAAAVGAAALGAVALGLWLARQEAIDVAERDMRSTVNVVVGEVARTVHLYDGYLRGLAAAAGAENATGGTSGSADGFLARVELLPGPGGAGIVDSAGTVVAAHPPGAMCCDDTAERVAHAGGDDGLLITGPAFDVTAPNDARLLLSRGIAGTDGRFAGVVSAALRISHLRDILRIPDLGAGGRLSILTEAGYVVARQPSVDGAGDVLRQMPLPGGSAPAGDGPAVTVQSDPIENDRRLFVVAPVAGTPLIVVADRPAQDIYRSIYAPAALVGGAALLMAAVMLAFAFAFRLEFVHRAAAEALIDELAVTDDLTHLANARRLEEVLGAEWRRAVRNRTALAVLKLEIDGLAAINQRYGAASGDVVLRGVARVISQAIRRPGDVAARLGGGEFSVVLPDTAAEGAMMLAERMRSGVTEIETGVKLRRLEVRVTVGVGWGYPDREFEPEDLATAADRALDDARAAGRNRVARVDLGQRGFVLARR